MIIEKFNRQMKERGWFIFQDIISADVIDKMKVDIEKCYKRCRKIQVKNGLDYTENTCHHLIGQEQSFMDSLSQYEKINEYLEAYFCGKYILNSFGGNLLKSGSSYANEIHRDIRTFSRDLPLMLNTIIFLDDFTPENGATWLMDKAHLLPDKPSQEEFDKHKFQITGKSGTVVVWNSNLWHQAGVNNTDKPRRSVTPELSSCYYKPGFDYPRALGYGLEHFYSGYLRQVLGYHSRVPSKLEEWYRPKQSRFYRDNQG